MLLLCAGASVPIVSPPPTRLAWVPPHRETRALAPALQCHHFIRYHHPHLTSRTWYRGKSCPARYGQSIFLLLKTTRVETRVETVDPPELSILPQSPPHYHTDNQLPRAGQGWTRHWDNGNYNLTPHSHCSPHLQLLWPLCGNAEKAEQPLTLQSFSWHKQPVSATSSRVKQFWHWCSQHNSSAFPLRKPLMWFHTWEYM